MTHTSRDYGAEIDQLHHKLEELTSLVQRLVNDQIPQDKATFKPTAAIQALPVSEATVLESHDKEPIGAIYYSGHLMGTAHRMQWEPQERGIEQLLGINGEKAAKVLAALGHKQRLDLLKEVLKEPMTGVELVERLQMGTTGQLYHHLKALTGSDLLEQEERGGRYVVPRARMLPLLLLLASVGDVLDTSDYIDMTLVRNQPVDYLGDSAVAEGYDAHVLLWAVLENTILEHRAGFCSEVSIFIHEDGGITVADNGRGIPVKVLPQTEKPIVQSVMTDLQRLGSGYVAPGAEKGISIAVVNALSQLLTVEIRREGKQYRQQYRGGIPLTGVQIVGAASETGTSVTLTPNRDIFTRPVSRNVVELRRSELQTLYPELKVTIENGSC
ncbi:ATP-binding protein [Paenibacillus koleovorans]|uniref:ATP-binding protein n=1 Tax=Paenibacillus koleovorans TaxID=121608 RepID=UPI000FD940BE|nr:ATP-binding protein [Paenibacillus koleovorans]